MDIAVTGLAPLLPDPGRFRSRPDAARADNNQQNSPQNRPESRNDNAAGERVVRGEVISSRVTQQRNVNSTQGALDGRGASSQQSDARQISIRAAVQNYRDNEALIAPQGENRQVSGIIDEYV